MRTPAVALVAVLLVLLLAASAHARSPDDVPHCGVTGEYLAESAMVRFWEREGRVWFDQWHGRQSVIGEPRVPRIIPR